jgi:CheY-like chemotaxis protein
MQPLAGAECLHHQMNEVPCMSNRPLKVLVAEDNLINQRLVTALLKTLGHTGVVVADGDKALKCLSQLQFDAVLMDVMMPVMDGLEALCALREQEKVTGTYLPVVMATAHAEPGDAEKFQAMGADGYVCKPIALEDLQKELARVCVLKR